MKSSKFPMPNSVYIVSKWRRKYIWKQWDDNAVLQSNKIVCTIKSSRRPGSTSSYTGTHITHNIGGFSMEAIIWEIFYLFLAKICSFCSKGQQVLNIYLCFSINSYSEYYF